MKPLALLLTLTLLAACGVDGAPVPPEDDPQPGVQLRGTASIGIVG